MPHFNSGSVGKNSPPGLILVARLVFFLSQQQLENHSYRSNLGVKLTRSLRSGDDKEERGKDSGLSRTAGRPQKAEFKHMSRIYDAQSERARQSEAGRRR